MAGEIEAILAAAGAALTAREVEDGLDHFAGEVCEYARSIAPVFGDRPPKRDAPPFDEPGGFRDSIHVEHPRRGVRRVISRLDPLALWQELGTIHMPEYAVFSRTAEHFGGTAPVIGDDGVMHAQSHLRKALVRLAELHAAGAGADEIAVQQTRVRMARQQRSAEFRRGQNERRRSRRAAGRPGKGRRHR
ncbi:hypothetical protein ABW16_01755 [Mycolicibacter heraklionensis]|uniref:DUF222 domain-containing protein n=1 Tax=Mycolicibacter heraklionensis TaxID=512402 RepID=A0ABR5FKT6_9MYCO|nr:hypothetical protein [Mycolicibacter heraklionensis]KLO31585.1 hypothetical protein ABW16_01755 [Mycolicibacter heraklionensis]